MCQNINFQELQVLIFLFFKIKVLIFLFFFFFYPMLSVYQCMDFMMFSFEENEHNLAFIMCNLDYGLE